MSAPVRVIVLTVLLNGWTSKSSRKVTCPSPPRGLPAKRMSVRSPPGFMKATTGSPSSGTA